MFTKTVNNPLMWLILLTITPSAHADIVHLDDTIITFSLCTGNDCVNGENFGFDTFRLKENNLRIHFDDTSNSSSFPSNDWRFVFNDTANGGSNYFAVEDSTANRQVFRVDAGAPADSLRVNSSGNIGVGTSSAIVQVHVVDGNTPTVRLEQNGSSGFTPQAWDLGSNESNFFIRDVTNSSLLPFRIQPGAGNNSLVIENTGDIGLGTNTPTTDLHLFSTDGGARILVEETASTTTGVAGSGDTLLELRTNSNSRVLLNNTNTSNTWLIGQSDGIAPGSLLLSAAGETFGAGGVTGLLLTAAGGFLAGDFSDGNVEFSLSPTGDALIRGEVTAVAFNPSSSRTLKENFSEINPLSILDAVVNMPILKWRFKDDGTGASHIGPMAEDFFDLFGLGSDKRRISTVDSDGIALASIQALNQKLALKEQKIIALEAKLIQKDAQIQQNTTLLKNLSEKVNQLLGASAKP